jgi:glucose-1-phosphatase
MRDKGYIRFVIMSMTHFIPAEFRTLIFDLGGVIVNLAPKRTLEEFAKLSGKSINDVLQIHTTHLAFHAYETGRIGDAEFRNAVRTMFQVRANDDQIDRCWNAMLLDIPAEKLKMLTRLKRHFTTIALSNTNSIHLSYINEVILKGQLLDDYFHHAHYSHDIGLRKPDIDIYKFVLETHQITPGQSLFLDDNTDNIAAAKAVGMEALLIEHPDQVFDLFRNYA